MVALILSIISLIGVLFLGLCVYQLQASRDVLHRRIDIYYNEFERFEKVYRTERDHEMDVRSKENCWLRERIEKLEEIEQYYTNCCGDMDSLKGFVKEWVKQ